MATPNLRTVLEEIADDADWSEAEFLQKLLTALNNLDQKFDEHIVQMIIDELDRQSD
jgi:hypothetical protein